MLRDSLQNQVSLNSDLQLDAKFFYESFELSKLRNECRLLAHWGMFWLIIVHVRTATVVQIDGPLSSVSCLQKAVSSRCLEMCRDWASLKLTLSLSLAVFISLDFLNVMLLSLFSWWLPPPGTWICKVSELAASFDKSPAGLTLVLWSYSIIFMTTFVLAPLASGSWTKRDWTLWGI